jgi:glycosyltransferase involved in cell wall biosynthesis
MAGTPTVSTRVGSVAEIVRHGETGLLSSTDTQELAEHTVSVLSDPVLARRMGDAAQKWTRTSFDVDRLVTDTEALYRLICHGSRQDRVTTRIRGDEK